jgi:hypothetical protein
MSLEFNPLPSRERLHELFELRDDGVLVRKKRSGPRGNPGAAAGCQARGGYVLVKVDNVTYSAHRLTLCMSGVDVPESMDVDHINGNRSDNRPANLRVASRLINMQNRAAQSKGKELPLGVLATASGRFAAALRKFGTQTHLGTFDTPQEAHDAYLAAKFKFHAGAVPERFTKEVA